MKKYLHYIYIHKNKKMHWTVHDLLLVQIQPKRVGVGACSN